MISFTNSVIINDRPDKEIIDEIDIYLRSKSTFIHIATYEEERVIDALRLLADQRNKKLIFWSCSKGLFEISKEGIIDSIDETNINNNVTAGPIELLNFAETDEKTYPQISVSVGQQKVLMGGGAIYVILDANSFFPSINGNPLNSSEVMLIRKIKDLLLSDNLSDLNKTIILMGKETALPSDIQKQIPAVEWPLPDKKVICDFLQNDILQTIEEGYAKIGINRKFSKEEIGQLSSSVSGLSLPEIESVINNSVVRNQLDNKNSINDIIKSNIMSKKSIIQKSRSGLEFYDVSSGLSSVGGLLELKKWFNKRKGAYSEKAIEYGLEYPNGILITGIPGTGKSLTAKSIAYEWNVPCLRFDFGQVYSALVGSSEANIRRVIQTTEAIAPCVLWIDEMEKAFSGIESSSRSDGGVAERVFGTVLQWFSDKTAPVFVVGTINRIEHLPAELLRKGRFDAIIFVDIPNEKEREEIFTIHINKRKAINKELIDINKLVMASEDFTGAEIEEAIKASLYTAYNDGARLLKTEDILEEIENAIPLAVTMQEDIVKYREWADKKAIHASGRRTKEEIAKTKNELKNKGTIELAGDFLQNE